MMVVVVVIVVVVVSSARYLNNCVIRESQDYHIAWASSNKFEFLRFRKFAGAESYIIFRFDVPKTRLKTLETVIVLSVLALGLLPVAPIRVGNH